MIEGLRVAAGDVIAGNAIAVARTSEDDLECAVRDHARLVYRIAFSVLRNHHDAEDAAQEVFVRVLRHRRKLAKVEDLRAWLAKIAWRVAVQRRKRVSDVALDDLGDDVAAIRSRAEAADDMLLANERAIVVAKLIATLPAELRDAITLSTVSEMKVADIAKLLGTNEAAIRSRTFRARQILRDKLAAILGTL